MISCDDVPGTSDVGEEDAVSQTSIGSHNSDDVVSTSGKSSLLETTKPDVVQTGSLDTNTNKSTEEHTEKDADEHSEDVIREADKILQNVNDLLNLSNNHPAYNVSTIEAEHDAHAHGGSTAVSDNNSEHGDDVSGNTAISNEVSGNTAVSTDVSGNTAVSNDKVCVNKDISDIDVREEKDHSGGDDPVKSDDDVNAQILSEEDPSIPTDQSISILTVPLIKPNSQNNADSESPPCVIDTLTDLDLSLTESDQCMGADSGFPKSIAEKNILEKESESEINALDKLTESSEGRRRIPTSVSETFSASTSKKDRLFRDTSVDIINTAFTHLDLEKTDRELHAASNVKTSDSLVSPDPFGSFQSIESDYPFYKQQTLTNPNDDFYSKFLDSTPESLESSSTSAHIKSFRISEADKLTQLQDVTMKRVANTWSEFNTPANMYSLVVSTEHIWFTDKSENIYYSSVSSPKGQLL